MKEVSGQNKIVVNSNDEIVRYISDLLDKAKVSDIYQLKGIPVEAEFEKNSLKNWRILTEVL